LSGPNSSFPAVAFDVRWQWGTSGQGRGFVLMPSACPYGRILSSLTLRNYEKMVEIVESQ